MKKGNGRTRCSRFNRRTENKSKSNKEKLSSWIPNIFETSLTPKKKKSRKSREKITPLVHYQISSNGFLALALKFTFLESKSFLGIKNKINNCNNYTRTHRFPTLQASKNNKFLPPKITQILKIVAFQHQQWENGINRGNKIILKIIVKCHLE